MKYYNVEIPIIRRGFEETKSSKFKGKLLFVCSNNGVIFYWKIIFEFVSIDLLTTKSWFINKTNTFKLREKLFEKLNIPRQEERLNKHDHKLIELDKNQITTLNNFLNDRKEYKSTIKNIVGILKGSNPKGEFSKPKSSEIITNDNEFKNFVLLIDDLILKTREEENSYDCIVLISKKITLNTFWNNNETLKKFNNFLLLEKDANLYNDYLEEIKNFRNEYNPKITQLEKEINIKRNNFSKNIKRELLNKKLPFGEKLKLKSNIFQMAHIYPVSIIKSDIISKIINGESKDKYSKYLDWIDDHNNFLPFIEPVHREFDNLKFTYNEFGEIKIINNKDIEDIDYLLKRKYSKIEKEFLNKGTIFYLNERNKKFF